MTDVYLGNFSSREQMFEEFQQEPLDVEILLASYDGGDMTAKHLYCFVIMTDCLVFMVLTALVMDWKVSGILKRLVSKPLSMFLTTVNITGWMKRLVRSSKNSSSI